MTERWRKKLEGIDGASPSDDVFERAKEGPMHHDDALPGPRMSTRVVTIVAAFLVFVLAISVFAIPALRMGNEAAGPGSVLLPLWPAQTSDALEQLQAEAPAWAFDPQQVAARFGQQVMGWPDASVDEAACDLPTTASGSPSYASPMIDPYTGPARCGSDVLWGGQSGASSIYPVAASSGGPATDTAFKTYAIYPFRQLNPPWSDQGPEFVQVYQPLEQGDGQIWAVLQAKSAAIALSVAAGQNVHDGASISAGFLLEGFNDTVPTLAYASCGSSAASSASHAPAGSYSHGIALDVALTSSPTCEGMQPGYAWAATANTALGSETGEIAADPLRNEPPTPGGLRGLTAAPVTMVFPQADAETTATPSPTPDGNVSPTNEPESWTTYDGGLGFTMELPVDWGTTSVTDEIVVNAPEGDPYIQITRVDDPPQNDSSFPLDFADYEGDNQPHFYGDGQTFIIQWLTGTADPLTPEQSAVVERIVESIRFKHWSPGETRNGWTVAWNGTDKLPMTSPAWVAANDAFWIVTTDHQLNRVAYGPVEMCNGASTSADEQAGTATITCANGAAGTWDRQGAPASGNSPAFDHQLDSRAAIVSWDGYLLAQSLP